MLWIADLNSFRKANGDEVKLKTTFYATKDNKKTEVPKEELVKVIIFQYFVSILTLHLLYSFLKGI
jgi:hypothetical protein